MITFRLSRNCIRFRSILETCSIIYKRLVTSHWKRITYTKSTLQFQVATTRYRTVVRKKTIFYLAKYVQALLIANKIGIEHR